MTQGTILALINQSMVEILFISVPILGFTMILGLIISIFQATTSLQEQTLTFVPKFVLVTFLLAITAPFFMTRMLDFTTALFNMIATARM